jgi:hypothetical protein
MQFNTHFEASPSQSALSLPTEEENTRGLLVAILFCTATVTLYEAWNNKLPLLAKKRAGIFWLLTVPANP